MKSVIFFLVGLVAYFSFLILPGCSTATTSDVLCDYGTVVCDVTQSICRDVPFVPQEVCDYLDLACYNLDQLCLLRDSPESAQYKAALTNLAAITQHLKEWKLARDKTK